MIEDRQRGPLSAQDMHLSRMYKSLVTSLAIGLLLTALILVGYTINSILRRKQSTTLVSIESMSSSKESDEPLSLVGYIESEAELGDPLAGVYYPITSGQLVMLADRRSQQAAQLPSSDTSIGPTNASNNTQVLEERTMAYLKYIEGHANGETWQRKVIVLDQGRQPPPAGQHHQPQGR